MAGNVTEYFAPSVLNPFSNVTVNIVSEDCLGGEIEMLDEGFGSSVWSANLLIFIPLVTSNAVLVDRFFWRNGITVDGNTDVGIYSLDGATKLTSTGSTANAGVSTIQIVNVSDFLLPAGRQLWLTLGCNSSLQTFWNTNLLIAGLDFIGVKQQAAGWSSGLPSSVTPTTPTVAKMPLFGFTGKSVI